MRYVVALLIENLQAALKFERSPQTWSEWREVVGLKGAQYCSYKQALYLTAQSVMRLEGHQEIEFGDVVTYLLKNAQRIAAMLKPFVDQQDLAAQLPQKRHPVTGTQLADELSRLGRRVGSRRLRDWVSTLDAQGKLTIDNRPNAPKFNNRIFTPEDVDALFLYAKQIAKERQERGRERGRERGKQATDRKKAA